MTATPWSVKGIDPKAREVAKDLARRSGMTLGEWLNRIILEDDLPEDVASESHFDDYQMRPRLSVVGAAQDPTRVAQALDRLTDRIEASETRTGLAISGVEHSVRQALGRIEAAEREHMALATRTTQAQDGVAERLGQLETDVGPRSAEALMALAKMEARLSRTEAAANPDLLVAEVVGRLGERLAQVEARTTATLESLRGALTALDGRFAAFESVGAQDMTRRFEHLATGLTAKVEAARADVAARLAGAGTEQQLADMARHVAAAEQRSTLAIQTIGREVLSVAVTLNRRIEEAEQRAAADLGRMSSVVDGRLDRADEIQADALSKLGAEIGRITERLSERVLQSERRAAQALDDVGEQVARVAERMEQSHERASTDLGERIRLSEERTAKLLADAQARFENRAAEASGRVAAATPGPEPVAASSAALVAERLARVVAPEADPFVAPSGVLPPPVFVPAPAPAAAPASVAPRATAPLPVDDFQPAAEFRRAEEFEAVDEFLDLTPPTTPLHRFAAEDFDAADGFAPIAEAEEHAFEMEPLPPPIQEGRDAQSTREVIDRARAAARAADAPRVTPPGVRRPETPPPRPRGPTDTGRPKRSANSTLQTALLVAGGAAFLSVGAAGVVLMDGPANSSPPEVVEPAPDTYTTPETPETPEPPVAVTPAPQPEIPVLPQTPTLPPVATAPPVAAPQPAPVMPRAVAPKAVAPRSIPPRAAVPAPAPTVVPSRTPAAGDYPQILRDIQAKQPDALGRLRALADAGYTPAQIFLAKLYESGEGGVTANRQEARRWIARAAEAGDRAAMHDMGIYAFQGEGGSRDLVKAAEWFRKAAERGVVDSQYNLGLLYRSGSGVPMNQAEAYKWFNIAAAGGDPQARSAAVELEPKIPMAERVVAAKAAKDFKPLPSAAPRVTGPAGD